MPGRLLEMSMEKVQETFIGFLFSIKNILFTLVVNFIVLGFYWRIYQVGLDNLYVGKVGGIITAIFLSIVYIFFWILSYTTFKTKTNKS